MLQNKKYVSKDGDYYERGTPIEQGKRNNIKMCVEHVIDGGSIKSLFLRPNINYQAIRCAEIAQKLFEKPRDHNIDVEVIWIYGSSGSGKTRYVYDVEKELPFRPTTAKWWEDYDGDGVVLIDDWRPNWVEFDRMLWFMDRYPFKVETKGGSRQAKYRRLYITTPFHPKFIDVPNEDNYQQ